MIASLAGIGSELLAFVLFLKGDTDPCGLCVAHRHRNTGGARS